MKKLKLTLVLMLVTATVLSAVNPYHAMNVFKGKYKFQDEITGELVEFVIDKSGSVKLVENYTYYVAKTTVNYLGNDLGPGGLSVMTVMLAGGSDEQTTTLHVRLFPEQHGTHGTVAKLLDMVMVENDGPNEVTSVQVFKAPKLFKQKKSGEYVEI